LIEQICPSIVLGMIALIVSPGVMAAPGAGPGRRRGRDRIVSLARLSRRSTRRCSGAD
jgi:hypothetical protein